ncbi:MAG TPA: DUF2993 domain-containing protein [Propionibacteriaceae bacterium]
MAARRSGARRAGLALVLVVVVLALLIVVADRVGQQVVERRVAQQLQTELGTASPPSVDIEGFPFVTQVLRRSFSSVHVVAEDVQAPDQPTKVKQVDLRLHDVTSQDNFATSTAARVDGTATLDYPTAQKLTGQPLRYAREGRVEVSQPTDLMGVPVTARVIGRPVVDAADQTLSLGDPELTVAGVDVPDTTSKALLDSIVKPAPVRGVPFGLKIIDVTAMPEGLVAGVQGSDVTFSR